MQTLHRILCISLTGAALLVTVTAQAKEDIEFASEHIAEVGLENRLATLPLWGTFEAGQAWSVLGQFG